VPFTLVHAEKYRTEDKIAKKQTKQNTAKQNYPGLVAFYDNQPGNKVGLFYNAPRGHTVHSHSDLDQSKLLVSTLRGPGKPKILVSTSRGPGKPKLLASTLRGPVKSYFIHQVTLVDV